MVGRPGRLGLHLGLVGGPTGLADVVLTLPREYVFVLPAYGEPPEQVKELIEQLRHEAGVWLRDHRLTGSS